METLNKREITRVVRKEKFTQLIEVYNNSVDVQRMSDFIQHGTTTTLEHCKNVAWVCFLLDDKLNLKANQKVLLQAAMLHDFYLYDWHDGKPERRTHGFDHPFIASKNARQFFDACPEVCEAINSHMWPLNFTTPPKSKEAILLCLADKYCALVETFGGNVCD